jgi:hypothetical protein
LASSEVLRKFPRISIAAEEATFRLHTDLKGNYLGIR